MLGTWAFAWILIVMLLVVSISTLFQNYNMHHPNYHTIVFISHAKVMLKILQASLQQYMNRELPDIQAGFRKGRGTRDQIANIHWIIKKA